MSTTSEISSHASDFDHHEVVTYQMSGMPPVASACAVLGQFYPAPVSNFASSPLFQRKRQPYESTGDVVGQYQKLLADEFRKQFPDSVAVPSLSTRLDFLWVGFSEELFGLLAQQFAVSWRLVLITDVETDLGIRVPMTCPIGYESVAFSESAASDSPLFFSEKAKVRFKCPSCSNDWTSMQGRVDFRVVVLAGQPHWQGVVLFRLYNQTCGKCRAEVQVLWFDDEVVRVLTSLYFHLATWFHNADPRSIWNPIKQRPTGRDGKPKNGHKRELCVACKSGSCLNQSTPANSAQSSRAGTPAPNDCLLTRHHRANSKR